MGAIYRQIGVIGTINLSLLFVITVARFHTYLQSIGYTIKKTHHKKILFFVFLMMTTLTDFPMYISFIVNNDYNVTAYAFHKYENFFLFGAYSITLWDWIFVLKAIRDDDSLIPHLLRRNLLLGANAVLFFISTINFIYCVAMGNMDSFIQTKIYTAGIYIQLLTSFIVTIIMLNAGLKLRDRILGATGSTGIISFTPSKGSRKSYNINQQQSSEFSSALRCLIIVMIVVSLSILLQIVLLLLNLVGGFSSKASAYPCNIPPIVYWIFYAWVPLWGPILALLYLSRSHTLKESDSSMVLSDGDMKEGSLDTRKDSALNQHLLDDNNSDDGSSITGSQERSAWSNSVNSVGYVNNSIDYSMSWLPNTSNTYNENSAVLDLYNTGISSSPYSVSNSLNQGISFSPETNLIPDEK